jgi:hypothetical protein
MSVSRTVRGVAIPAALVAAATCLSAATALAAAPNNGCPPGYRIMSVVDLSQQGYLVPAQVDSSTSGILSFGRPGNDDGWVCAVRLGNQLTPFDKPIYNFWDNTLLSS